MIRKAIIIGALVTLAAHHVHAQSKIPAPPHNILGVWEGKYTSNHGPEGKLRITIAHDSTVAATMEFGSTLQVPPSAFKSITHTGSQVTWTQELLGTACEGTGTITEEKFAGEIKCGPGLINFEVRKK